MVVIEITVGDIWGYSEIGNTFKAIIPIKVIANEMTKANFGR
ncbi:hypothetical protein VCHENC03_1156 [Vibrio sp. HENC-03]|nr:hypothetical protein VCHENC03_1156 [Vibrio sp. HENC-03]